MTTGLWRELLFSLIIILSIIWVWRWMKGVAGSWKRWVGALIAIILLAIFGPSLWNSGWRENIANVLAGKSTGSGLAAGMVDRTVYYEYYWKLGRNQYVNGQNEAKEDERTLELVRLTADHFDLKQPYVHCGSPQICWFSLQRTGDRVWEGGFKQDYPEDHAKVTLIESEPGNYSLTQVWDDGKVASGYVKLRR